MQHLTLSETLLISGGKTNDPHEFSDLFIAGMKGEDISQGLTNIALVGGFLGSLAGYYCFGFTGVIPGAILVAAGTYGLAMDEYHKGANYAVVMQLIG